MHSLPSSQTASCFFSFPESFSKRILFQAPASSLVLARLPAAYRSPAFLPHPDTVCLDSKAFALETVLLDSEEASCRPVHRTGRRHPVGMACRIAVDSVDFAEAAAAEAAVVVDIAQTQPTRLPICQIMQAQT